MSKKGFDGLMQMVLDEAKNQFGNDFDTNENNDFYKMAASFIMPYVFLEDKAISLKRSMNIYTCQGQELDDILNNDIFPRIQGNKAKDNFTITGSNNVFCDIGTIQAESFNGLTFTNISSGTISNNILLLEFECDIATSRANLPPNNIERVIKAPSGVTDVQNLTSIENGLDVENDFTYLNRYLNSNVGETWVLQSIIAEVLKVAGVVSANGNRNNTMQTVDSLPPKSIRIIVKGGETQEICEAIYSKIHTPYTVGAESYDVEIIPGQTETIRFDRPTETSVDYKYNIIADKKDEILDLLIEYLNELEIGDFVSVENFRNKKIGCNNIDYGIKGISIQFKRSTESDYVDFLQLQYDEEGKAGQGVPA